MKKHSDHFFKNVSAMIQASFRLLLALHFPQRRLDEDMEHSFTTRRPPSCLQSRHFRFYPPHPSQLYLVCFQFLFFSNTKIKKRFSFRISSSLILFPAVSLHMNSFVKFEFLISWNLWNKKWKILTSLPSKNIKIEDYRLVFLFLKNKK